MSVPHLSDETFGHVTAGLYSGPGSELTDIPWSALPSKPRSSLHAYYEKPLVTTEKQPPHRLRGNGRIFGVYYIRDNTSAPTSAGTILIKKGDTTIYTVTIGTADADKTYITVSTTATTYSDGEMLTFEVSNAGAGIANITVQVDCEVTA